MASRLVPTIRAAFVTIGQSPRNDVVPELLASIGEFTQVVSEQFGALDGLSEAEVGAHVPAAGERRLYTRFASGTHVVLGAGFVSSRLEPLLKRLDRSGYDLIVLVSTGVDEPFHLSTPFVHAQQVVDGWIAALVMGDCELGLVYSLPDQHRGQVYGAMLQNARAAAAMGEGAHLEDVVQRLANADLILMHSISHTEAMARRMSALTGKPVVTARRIVAGAIRLRLAELLENASKAQTGDVVAGRSISSYLPDHSTLLTSRERDVLAVLLEGLGNKEIGRRLGISHRTVEIHRSRVFAKLNAASLPDLIRKVLLTRSG